MSDDLDDARVLASLSRILNDGAPYVALPGVDPATYLPPDPMVEAFRTELVDTGRLSEAQLSATIAAAAGANGAAFGLTSKLSLGAGDINIAVAGDSTGNASNEWPTLTMNSLATAFPAVGFKQQLVNQDTDLSHYDYLTETVISAGLVNTGEVLLVRDTFDGTGDLRGSAANTGQLWGGPSNSAGDFTRGGGVITRTADATASESVIDGATVGDMRTEYPGMVFSTVTPASNRVRTFYCKYLNSSNYVAAVLTVTTAGVISLVLQKRIANVATSIQTFTSVLAGGNAALAVDLTLSVVGLTITCVMNGTTRTATLLQADADALADASSGGLLGSLQDQGGTFSEFKLYTLGSPTAAQTVKLWNGSKSGSTLQFQTDHLAALYPPATAIDVLFISSCHNYGGYTPAQYFTALDAFVTAYRALHPESGIVVCSQNPQKPGTLSNNRAAHLTRLAALRQHCAEKRYGYVPVIEAFSALSDRGWSLINSDGIHPSGGEGVTGSAKWRDTVYAYLTANGLTPQAP